MRHTNETKARGAVSANDSKPAAGIHSSWVSRTACVRFSAEAIIDACMLRGLPPCV